MGYRTELEEIEKEIAWLKTKKKKLKKKMQQDQAGVDLKKAKAENVISSEQSAALAKKLAKV